MQPQHASLFHLIRSVACEGGDDAAYRVKIDGQWVDRSWTETLADITRVSKALIAQGVKRGDRVAVLATTRLEWLLCDFGVVSCGGVTVGIYQSNLAPDCAYVIGHSDSEVILVENDEQLDKVLRTRAELPRLRRIVVLEGASDPDHDVLSWQDFLATGDAVGDDVLEARGAELGRDDLASLVYTSGTTGVPKGVMISHGNLLFTTESVGQSLYFRAEYVTILFLPLAHVFARLIAYACLAGRVTVAFAEDIGTVAANIREIRPHFIASVPRVYEKIYDKVLSGAEAAGGIKQKLFNWALAVGYEVSRRRQAGAPVTGLLALRHAIADRLVLGKVRDALGGRLVYAVSGAAPLNKTIAEFFHACGVTILEGIGMTENTSFTNVNRLDRNKFGTVGPTGPGIEMKLAPDGEVLFRGDNVMQGYFKNPESTAETIDADGWLHTGDIGEIDDEGFLRITDRKKDLIITAGGKNVAPQRIERIMRTSHYVAHVVAYGDRRKYLTALISLDPEHIGAWAREHGLGDAGPEQLASDPQVHALIAGEVERLNTQLASFETIKKFHIVARDFTVEGGELTPTLKIKRKVVYERYADDLERLYAS